MILIVDDQDFNIQALEIVLKYNCKIDIDKSCVSAGSGEEALQAIRDNFEVNDFKHCDFELILMDIMMPT